MGFLSRLVGGSVAEPIQAVGNILTSVMGDKGEKLSHEQIMAKLAAAPQLAQTEINKVEAGHRSIFVAGWRPAVGWVCVLGLGIAFIVNPYLPVPAELPMDYMTELLWGLLGLGALRTVEKLNGKAR